MIELIAALVLFFMGYALRGFISKEIKAVGTELKTIVSDFKSEVATLKAEAAKKL